jgi:UPF0042 nucleotide-binding protein
MSSPSTRIVFVSGLSGSGRSTTMAALEDLSFYCVDNLPPQLVSQFLALCTHATPAIEKIALAVDAREERFLSVLPEVLAELRDGGTSIEMIFLDCADEILEKRYRETRRVHPLSPTSVVDGIESERALLADVAALADFRIDTSSLNVHQLRETVTQHISGETRNTVVNILSFGFRNGPPRSAELLFDLRFLPNPYWEDDLRAFTGEDPAVADFVLDSEQGTEFFARLRDFVDYLLPHYDEEGKAYLTIGLGCTGGQHRSVAVAIALARELAAKGREVNLEHRDMPSGDGPE